jgi:hypothetical protein
MDTSVAFLLKKTYYIFIHYNAFKYYLCMRSLRSEKFEKKNPR